MNHVDIRPDQTSRPAPSALTRRLGREVLGPVMHRWMLALHDQICQLDDGDTAFLFCARAGLRIQRLYELWLEGQEQAHWARTRMFWISRVSICKGIWAREPERAGAVFAREYHDTDMGALVRGLLRHNPDRLKGLQLDGLPGAGGFVDWIREKGSAQDVLRDYLRDCGPALDGTLTEVAGGAKRVVLIDSGWQGTAQSLLNQAYPDREWMGLYFGRMLGPHHDPLIAQDVVGLMFERNGFDPDQPTSAVTAHHHVIETLLEPNGPSVEELPHGPFADVAQGLIDANRAAPVEPVSDALWLEVEAWIAARASDPVAQVMARATEAEGELARLLITPSRDEALALVCKDRSADFGKALEVPVLVDPDSPDHVDFAPRQADALWKPGQIALELSGNQARDAQLRSVGQEPPNPHTRATGSGQVPAADADPEAQPAEAEPPLVAIITRTKDRPILLERAAESVAAQSWTNYLWVVVNDGGDRAPVEKVIENSGVDPRKVRLVSNSESLGMEAASNAGIRSVDSDYVVIHDDDDSWTPEFLEKTVAYLEGPMGARYGGVITKSVYVSEEILDDEVVIHERRPYQDWVRNVEFAEMACGNFFPPIAFLFRRSVYDTVGGYNESLPVLGDWFFNLEFLLEADIGMLHEPLALYHHRDRVSGRTGLYSNSVIGGHSKHVEFAAVVRNEFLRRHSNSNVAALALAMGYMNIDTRGRLNNLAHGRPAGPVESASVETLERLTLVAQVNGVAARRWWMFWCRQTPLDPQADWDQIAKAIRCLRMKVPVPASWDDAGYLARNPDVASVLRDGKISSGYEHYVRWGRAEGRER